jgi:hypothetical protein
MNTKPMTFTEAVDACVEALLCDKCLFAYRRDPEILIGEFCPRCQRKMGSEYSEMLNALIGIEIDEED